MPHDCKQTGKNGELVFICSRCGACYHCKHKLVYLEQGHRWVWKCADGKLRPVINDGRLKGK